MGRRGQPRTSTGSAASSRRAPRTRCRRSSPRCRSRPGACMHSSTLYLIEQQVELAEQIAELSGIPDAKVFFTLERHRGERDGAAAGDHRAPLQPGARAAQQLPRPLVRGDRAHRQPRLARLAALADQRQLGARRLPVPQPVARRSTPTSTSSSASPTCESVLADQLERRRRVHDLRADPGRRRLRHAAGRPLRRLQGRARRARHPA